MTNGPCSIEGCVRPWVARGLCGSHYQREYMRDKQAAWRKRNAKSRSVKRRAYYRANLERERERARAKRIRLTHGLTTEEHAAMLARPCAICGKSEKRMAVDHDHATGRIRGTLCANCNAGIGLLGDDPSRLRAAVTYLEGFIQRAPRSAPDTEDA